MTYAAGMSKRTSYDKIYRPDDSTRPRLRRGCVFIHGRVFTISADSKKCVHADAPRVVLSDVLGGKDVVEGRDGRTDGRFCLLGIGRNGQNL
jgi:hypothetical protein